MTNQLAQMIFEKRRYDGGSEVETIANIELLIDTVEARTGGMAELVAADLDGGLPAYINLRLPTERVTQEAPDPEPQPAAVKPSLGACLFQYVLMPFLELIMGCSGVMAGTLMKIPVLKQQTPNPDEFEQECQQLIGQSKELCRNSVFKILLIPAVLIETLFCKVG
jgi:hypothetical protein